MQRLFQLIFALSLVGLCWLAMMAVHELGHVLGAIATGGSVARVELHPLAISRTDVAPNPHPGIVVWCGPLVGCLLPLALVVLVSRKQLALRLSATFFAGFCLIANGAYISLGSFDRVGDCGEMLRTGSETWTLLAFGAVSLPLGLVLWHGLGSLSHFVRHPSLVTKQMACFTCGLLVGIVILELSLFG